MRGKTIIALAVFAWVFILCNALAFLLLPDVPSSLEEARNPFRFRGFPEFVRGSSQAPSADAKTVVLLSNSQAYAGELPPNYGYPYRLRKLLNQRAVGGCTNWYVLNWSSDGMTSIEYMILAAKLRHEQPDLVLAVTGYADYRAAHYAEGFGFCRTDVPRLATRWSIARELPRSYWRRHFKVEDTLTAWVHDQFPLNRFPEYFWSWMDFKFPGAQRLLYSPFLDYRPWELRKKSIAKPLQLKTGPAQELVFVYDRHSRELLTEYLGQLKRLSSPAIVISQPVRVNPDDFRSAWHFQFQEDIRSLASSQGVAYEDLSQALPGADFITSSHLNPDNHLRFAERLANVVASHLDGRN
ncbi:MAG TPA: hypothetical protein DCZ95_09395 [Verrucomicrobia bacterium]|nr:MAG: hypothetical protein A2X46_06340 [Lentisphaerae bacterium GWF2_57_35]HBA84293.1 hypothetical protein [Verrucomicrobiota bacterium]